LTSFFEEVTGVFPDAFLHVGGDEVSFDCWQSSPSVNAWMAAHGMAGNYTALESYYVQRVLNLVNGLGKSTVGYQEIFDNGLTIPTSTIIDAWKNPYAAGQVELAKITAAGYPALMSSGWCVRLWDASWGAARALVARICPSFYAPCRYINYEAYVNGGQWQTYYLLDPTNFTDDRAQKSLVLGGEFSLWAEFIDSTNLLSRGWPSGAAVAERLWSDASVTSIADASVRIQGHTCRLVARGIAAEPASGPSFCFTEFDFAYNPPYAGAATVVV
jgi:hexosaminidase